MLLKHELQNIISGDGKVRHGENIQTALNYLRGKKKAIPGPQEKWNKDQETEALINHIINTHL